MKHACFMKSALVSILFFQGIGIIFGQQDPISSQYLTNYFIINPAYAGMTKDLNLTSGYRRQWVGFNGSPVTFNATGHISLAKNRMGVGFSIVEDKIGSYSTTEANAAYAYHIKLTQDLQLSFGLQAGMINYRSNYNDLHIDPSDPKFNSGISEVLPNFGAGVLLRSEKFMFSIAVPHLLNPTKDPTSISTGLYAQNLYVFGTYMLPVSYRVKVQPTVLVRAVKDASISVDYGMAMKVDDSYTVGLFTRNFNTLGFRAQMNVGDVFRFGYVFELPTNKSVGFNFTSHEVMVGIRLKALHFHNPTDVRDF